ncbi:transcription factor SPN1 [Nematocida sp. AWRm77]|nr:transcription factor SPN1 [Nematocida sp. AWRm77]
MEVREVLEDHETKEAKDLVRQLNTAAETDMALNKAGKPAIEKFLLLDTVYSRLMNRKLHENLLDAHVLSALKKWLEPLPDCSLPPDEVKKKVLEVLAHFHPETEHLVESGVGKIVLFYSKSPYEKKPIQRQARELVLKWIEVAKESE